MVSLCDLYSSLFGIRTRTGAILFSIFKNLSDIYPCMTRVELLSTPITRVYEMHILVFFGHGKYFYIFIMLSL